jgi:hypothetical protein
MALLLLLLLLISCLFCLLRHPFADLSDDVCNQLPFIKDM